MLTALSHVMLYVNDVSRAAQWYVDTFGFKIQFIAAPYYGILYHDPMKFRLDLHPTKTETRDNVGRGPQPFFVSDDLDAEVKSLRARGVSVDDPRSESGSPRFCNFKDCEGNVLGLCEKR